MATIKVKPWGEGQGDFVIIEEQDFDAEKHELSADAESEAPKRRRNAKADAEQAKE